MTQPPDAPIAERHHQAAACHGAAAHHHHQAAYHYARGETDAAETHAAAAHEYGTLALDLTGAVPTRWQEGRLRVIER
jgi:hypothetical protein